MSGERFSEAVKIIRAEAERMTVGVQHLHLSGNPDDWWKGSALEIRAHGVETAAQILMNQPTEKPQELFK